MGFDGTGGPLQDQRFNVCATATYVTDTHTREYQYTTARTPGFQIVPRAELWALISVLKRQRHWVHITYFIDASYVVNGTIPRDGDKHSNTSGDPWTMIYPCHETRKGNATFVKVTSHCEDEEA